MNKTELREYLIQHLDNCLVPYKKWGNRDTPSAQEHQAKMRMYLRAGCDFKLMSDYNKQVSVKASKKFLDTTNRTMYISILHYDFEDE